MSDHLFEIPPVARLLPELAPSLPPEAVARVVRACPAVQEALRLLKIWHLLASQGFFDPVRRVMSPGAFEKDFADASALILALDPLATVHRLRPIDGCVDYADWFDVGLTRKELACVVAAVEYSSFDPKLLSRLRQILKDNPPRSEESASVESPKS